VKPDLGEFYVRHDPSCCHSVECARDSLVGDSSMPRRMRQALQEQSEREAALASGQCDEQLSTLVAGEVAGQRPLSPIDTSEPPAGRDTGGDKLA
jgi:hypothetical protein